MKISIEKKKEKAIELMKILGIYKPYIKGFEQDNAVCFYEKFGGFWAWQEPELMEKIKAFEEKHNCLVYAVTHEYTEFGECYDFLYITQNIILIDSKDFLEKVNPYNLQEHEYDIPKLRCIKDCAREWNNNRKSGDRFIHPDEIREFLQNDPTVFKYKYHNKWIVNYDQLLPHLKKMNRRESKKWKEYMARLGIKKSVTPRKK